VPPALEALVPNYLPRLPADPFRGDGGPVSYAIVPGGLPGGGSRPIVYSVGPDGADDLRRTGRSVLPTTPCFGFVRGVPDRVCDLVRWAPPAAPDPAEAEEEQRWKDPAGPAPTIQPAR